MAEETPGPENPAVLRQELSRYRTVVAQLQDKIRSLEEDLNTASTMAEMPALVVSRPELRKTLSRLINKVAMIVQAEKVMIMLYQAESGELTVLPPTLGISEEQAQELRAVPDEGIAGLVYSTGESAVYNDAASDPRTLDSVISLLNIRNGVCVPLIIKQRDEEERVTEERVIGVLQVLNKRYEQDFNDDDLRLLEMLSDQAAAIISRAQLFIELSEEKQELEDTFETIRSGVIVTTTAGTLRLINPAACDMLGIPHYDYGNEPFEDVIQHDDVIQFIQDAIDNGGQLSREIPNVSGDKIYKGESAMMGGDNGQPSSIVAIFTDITEIRQVERMKTAFVSTVSHELRTPLTSIKGFVSTLLEDREGELYDADTRYEFYTIIDQECDRLTRLIDDLLNISRIEAGRSLQVQISEVDVLEIAKRVVATQQQYTSHHDLVANLPEDLPTIEADPDKLYQILDNLIGNAVKYSPDGGTVELTGEDEGDHIRLDVRDEGMGVPEEARDAIFERFQMVDEADRQAIKGTGIGLYLVRHLARAHGKEGDVWLKWSEEGEGSVFSVRLPKVAEPSEKDQV